MPAKKSSKNPLATQPFEYNPTKLGKAIMKVVEDPKNDELWDNFFTIFLNTRLWLPAVEKINPRTKETTVYPILDVEKNGQENLVLFEKSARVKKWHFDHKGDIVQELAAAEYSSGFSYIKSIPLSLLKNHNLCLDFGKNIYFALDPETTLMLRKRATVL